MIEQTNIDVIQEVYAAFTRGDMPAILSRIDPEADLIFEAPAVIPWAGNWHGLDGWTRFFQTLAEAADEIVLQMEPFAAEDEHLVTIGRYQARVKSTGKRIDAPLIHLWTLRDSKVIRCLELTNTAAEAAACNGTDSSTLSASF